MFSLWLLLLLMLIASLCLIVVPFVIHNAIYSKSFLLVSLIIVVMSLGLYHLTGNKPALNQWITTGKDHYRLLETVNQLGGINGLIARVRHKLEADPHNAQGWFILGKLYLSKEDNKAAYAAFSKAHELQPENDNITYYQKLAGTDQAAAN
jgi:cytochrome c-type biogenesis protein CcmH